MWLRNRIELAVKYCTKHKMTKTDKNMCTYFLLECPPKTNHAYIILRRKDLYDATILKYLVLTRDEVEQGDQKLKELEMELEDMGLYDSDFSLGDVLEEVEEEGGKKEEPLKKKLPEYPVVEGEESVVEYVGQYKKACISKKALLKSTKDRLEKDNAKGHETLF